MNRKTLTLVIQITALVTCAMVAVFVAAQLWPQAGGAATCMNTRCFCEVPRDGIIKQLVNALSSLVFVAVAAYAWLRLGRLRASRIFQGFTTSLIVIGLGSAYYHATLSFAGQWLDVLGMYLFGTVMICASLLRSGLVLKKSAMALCVLISSVLAAVQFMLPDVRRYLFALVIIIALVLELMRIKHPQSSKRFYCGLALMAAAYAVWLLDQFQIVCAPSSLMQGHALWHILTAFAALQIVRYYGDSTKETL